jgi:phage repressor protein C with HTH and peptisase S24 domain
VETIDEIRHANLLLILQQLAADGGERGAIARLADLTGKSHSHISQLKARLPHSTSKRPRNIGSSMARELEQAVGHPPGWMDVAHDAPPNAGAPARGPNAAEPAALYSASARSSTVGVDKSPGVPAHLVSQSEFDDGIFIPWEILMTSPSLPPRFAVDMPDDSMSPRLRPGQRARFDRDLAPRAGDCVLVRAAGGDLFVRLYRERRPGVWEACPINDAYQPLEVTRDGLAVVAVLTGVDGRWA